jgi:succinate dehydrogenase / fumarate reductase cytochrome b subunit
VNKSPVNLDLRTIRMPLAAILSILHRISGVIIFLGLPILLWLFSMSLSSAEDFAEMMSLLDNMLYRLMFFGILMALGYHIIAGIKHLFMDKGYFETKESSKIASIAVICLTLLLFIFLGAQI